MPQHRTVGGWTLGTTVEPTLDGHLRRPDRLACQLQRHRHAGAATPRSRRSRRPAPASPPTHQHPERDRAAQDAYGNDLTTGSAIVTISQLSAPARSAPWSTTATAPTRRPSRADRHRQRVFVATLNGDPVQNARSPGAGHRELRTRTARPFRLRDGQRPADGRQPLHCDRHRLRRLRQPRDRLRGPATLSASTGWTVSPTSIDFVNGVATPDVTLTSGRRRLPSWSTMAS